MKSLFPALLLHPLLFFSHPAGAQLSPQQLSERSRVMFADDNCFFIAVEMIKDGFLKPDGQSFEIRYGKDGVFLNHNKIPEPYNTRYSDMLLRSYSKSAWNSGGSMSGSLSEKALSMPYKHRQIDPCNNLKHLIDLMASDNLLPKDGNVAIYIRHGSVTVNGHELNTAVEEIYKQRIMEISGFDQQKEEATFGILVKH